MKVKAYSTAGGKNLIYDYLDKLPNKQRQTGYLIIRKLEEDGLNGLDTRQLRGKLWEIKFYEDNRIMYVIVDNDNIYLVHACKKQKGRAERFELDTAVKRAKEITDI